MLLYKIDVISELAKIEKNEFVTFCKKNTQ